ncbi:MAG TPA: hypothetical protein VI583_13520 [Cyclobacteriaceae bacterium]|nr:hypothetical protein [Cyclobacteriaceae bacterium]
MKIAKILLFFIFLAGNLRSEAQSNFVKGYYITNSLDTVRGYIEVRSGSWNNKKCVFRAELSSRAEKYYAPDIDGYVIDDKEYYESHVYSGRNGQKLNGFFKVLVRGSLSLLYYKTRYFAGILTGEVYEIPKRGELTDEEESANFAWMGVLKLLMKDCDYLSGDFLENEYRSNPNLAEIFIKYNNCMNSVYFKTRNVKVNPHFGFGLELSPTITKLNLNTDLEGAKFNEKLFFGFGAFTKIFLPKIDENISLIAEAAYNSYRDYAYFSTQQTNNDVWVDFSILRLPILIRYNPNRFFFDAGIQNLVILDQNTRWRVETFQSNTILTSEDQIEPLNKWSAGFLIGAGIRKKFSNYAIGSSLRYSLNQSFGHPNNPVIQSIELLLSFQLTK